MNSLPYNITYLNAVELDSLIDISLHREQQSGVFKNSTLDAAKDMLLSGISPSIMPIAYRDKESNKLVIVRQSEVFNHMLAIYFPEQMGIKLDRIKLNSIKLIDFYIHNVISTTKWLKMKDQLVENGATDLEVEGFLYFVDKYIKYQFPVIVYEDHYLAHTASLI